MSIHRDIEELIEADVISPETGEKIAAYYASQRAKSPNRLFVVFGVIGAFLVGLGIILIIAHNWDNLNRPTKVFFAFLPLVLSQGLAVYTWLKKYDATVWRESAAVLLFFSIGACLSMVSQIYHIPGALDTYLFTWMALALPIVYVLQSRVVSLAVLIGITWFAAHGFGRIDQMEISPHFYWLVLFTLVPFYFTLVTKHPKSNFTNFHHWVIPLSVAIGFGLMFHDHPQWMVLGYAVLFGVFYLLGIQSQLSRTPVLANGWRIYGALGSLILLLILTFDGVWHELIKGSGKSGFWFSSEMVISLVLFVLSIALFFVSRKRKESGLQSPFSYLFLVVSGMFFLGLFIPYMHVAMNIVMLAAGIRTIQYGAQENHLGILNLGLLMISALIIARFFDTDMSFVVRGLVFVVVGVGFFMVNYWMIKNRRPDDE